MSSRKSNSSPNHEEFIEEMKAEHGNKVKSLGQEITAADAAGYKRGIDEMIKQQGGDTLRMLILKLLRILLLNLIAVPPVVPDGAVERITEMSEMNEFGVNSTIARIDSRSGMLMLPIGSDRGMTPGEVFTLWKGRKEAARIKVQSTDKGFSLAYILPRFGEPNRLRPGDLIKVVPEQKKTL